MGTPAAAVPTSQPATLNVAPLPSEYTDIDVGWVKDSDCDTDSFMMYAALVPEHCRLEGMLVCALV
jgi:xylulokinase